MKELEKIDPKKIPDTTDKTGKDDNADKTGTDVLLLGADEAGTE